MTSMATASLTERGRRTRSKIVDAATVIFARHGFIDAKITDITREAGVASGSFYTYFSSKEEVFAAVYEHLNERMYAAGVVPADVKATTPAERIEHATRSYVRAYKANAGLLAVLEQASTFSNDFREMRRQIRAAFRGRTERGLRRLQASGEIAADLDPTATAEALTSMVSNMCFMCFVLNEPFDEDVIVDTLSKLWIRGICLKTQPSSTGRRTNGSKT